MFAARPKERELLSWIIVLGWVLFIYTAIPLARKLQYFIQEHLGRSTFIWIVALYLGFFLLLGFLYLLRSRKRVSMRGAPWLFITGAIFAGWTFALRDNPERALHFVQYGTLGLLTYRALLHRIQDPSIYFISILFCSVVGTIDEMIQWLTPGRFFDFNDIAINCGAAALSQLAIALGIKPEVISDSISRKGTRAVSNLAVMQLFLLLLCVVNTPGRVDWYSTHFPALSYLKQNPSVMAEYGFRYSVPDIGRFVSRMSPEELQAEDEKKGARASRILRKWGAPEDYGNFLKKFSSFTHPLVHEARVRIFRRDSYWARSANYQPGDSKYHEYLTIAYREHLILDRFYTNTYRNSNLYPQEKDIEFISTQSLPEKEYISPVSGNLITRFSERSLMMFILLGILFFLLLRTRGKVSPI